MWQSPWPLPETERWAKLQSRQLEDYFPKLQVLKQDAVPISVLNLRSTIRSPEAEQTERELTLLLINRLTHQPNLFVLERRRMELLTARKNLKGLDDTAFWNGSHLLEGIVDQNGYSREMVTINARLRQPRGGAETAIEVSGPRSNLPVVVDALVRRALETLDKAAPVASSAPEAEAEQYFEEAQWAFQWKVFAEAQRASEAAWALGNRSEALARLRVSSYQDAYVED